jgi:phosphotriesterase-related protein
MMAIVQTVLGKIEPGELGVTYVHEHLLFNPPEPYRTEDPDLSLDSISTAVKEVGFFEAAGGDSIVEMSTVDLGRDPLGLKKISELTGVHVIAATGFNKGKFCEGLVADKSLQTLTDRMIQDLTIGMDDTDIKAGLIKASSSKDRMTVGETKVFQAAVRAHLKTGAPISTHTEAGTLALEQIQILVNGGVRPGSILIGHLDRKLERDYLFSIAKTGVYMGFDQICKEKYYPDLERIRLIKKLIEAGYVNQIVLSADMARRSYWPSYGFGKGPGLTYILWRFVPWMLEEGISEQAVDGILTQNPKRLFSWID